MKAGSLGNKGSPSGECFQTCFSQAEELNQHIWGSPYHCNISRLRPHLDGPGGYVCKLLPFVKIFGCSQ